MANGTKLKCPLCGEGYLEDEISDHQTYVRQGKRNVKIVIKDLKIKRCSNCKEDFIPDEANARIKAEKHKSRGLLSINDLKALRKRLGYTQEEMAELLGLGKKTYFRWEKGLYLQNIAMDRYLRLLIENPQNIELLKKMISK